MNSVGVAQEATGNVAAVMTALGHSNGQMLMRYQHPQLNALREAMEANRSELTASSARAYRELVQ
ncbi:MAG: hypothetical protein CXZ00_00410 [Acidobacteria bacterium]|nr:MAG: hypothetical protein CXZ00_00410 [Acidobacteriota bacterium]